MIESVKAPHQGTKAFSETDFTEYLKSVDIPVLVMHGEDNQIVPFIISGAKAVKLLKKGKLISYPGFPHGIPATEVATIHKDLLAFQFLLSQSNSLYIRHLDKKLVYLAKNDFQY